VPSGRSEKGGPTIGVDLGGTKVAFAVVSSNGRILASHRHPTGADRGAGPVISDLNSCLTSCLGPAGRTATAVGIGVAGQVDRRGVVRTSPNLGWRNLALREKIEAAVHLPVTVTNDLRAITFGEWQYGAARGATEAVCVFVGTGIGGGIIAEGRLRYGATDTAGEVGHMTIVANGRKCHCPNSGCLEAYAGGWAIAERAREAARARPSDGARLRTMAGGVDAISAATVAEAARARDPLAIEIMAETADYLGAGLVSIVNGFNPEIIVLGGGVLDGTPSLRSRVQAIVKRHALGVAARRLRVVPSALGDNAGVLGAAAMARLGVPGGI
jgi:glucokinase